MKEIETKILDIDKRAVETQLRKLGAKKVGCQVLRAAYYVMPRGEMLRVRTDGDSAVITYKRTRNKSTIRTSDELEFAVDEKSAIKLFKALGYKIRAHVAKRRTTYSFMQSHVEIDEYFMPKVPAMLEIEAASAAKVKLIARKLGFSGKDCLSWTAADVFQHYKVKG